MFDFNFPGLSCLCLNLLFTVNVFLSISGLSPSDCHFGEQAGKRNKNKRNAGNIMAARSNHLRSLFSLFGFPATISAR